MPYLAGSFQGDEFRAANVAEGPGAGTRSTLLRVSLRSMPTLAGCGQLPPHASPTAPFGRADR